MCVNVCVYDGVWGASGPLTREVGMGVEPWLPVVMPWGSGGDFPGHPHPLGKGKELGESQARGSNPRVRRGRSNLVTVTRAGRVLGDADDALPPEPHLPAQ